MGDAQPGAAILSASAERSSSTRIFVVHHADVVRRGLVAVLDEVESFVIVGAAATARDALELTRIARPDVILLDLRQPDTSALELIPRLRHGGTGPLVVALAGSADPTEALEAFSAGAAGYVSSDSDPTTLVRVIEWAHHGQMAVDPLLGAQILQALAARAPATPSVPDALTPRELDVLRLLAAGHTNKEIASGLLLALGTVKVHIERIFGKLGASTRSEAAVRAIELGIVELPGEVAQPSRWNTDHRSLGS